MGSPLPPDPYEALGVSKDATSAAIKTAHRKLVLKCHPDKVTDPAEKQAASDKFHKIQSAYEILIDENRRERYDAQAKLAELRREAMARQPEGRSRGSEARTTSYKPEPPRSAYASRGERVVPQFEERRPAYASDYFDSQPRATSRKEPEYAERTSSRRTETKEKPRLFTRSTKENDKERRREKNRQNERDVRRERERKREPYVEDESESEADEYDWRSRRMREDEEARRARDAYHHQVPRTHREPEESYYDERARKMADHTADARDYIMSSRGGVRPRTEERRPSPVRMASSRDRVQYVKRDEGRPAYMMRRASEKPPKETKDEKKKEKESSRKTTSRTPERRSSAEKVDERRPPPLSTSKSSPADIHIPSEKQRAYSLQPDSAAMPPPPQPAKRSETMPYKTASRRAENVQPKTESTPMTSPDNQAPPQSKFPYARQPYADDVEYNMSEGYRAPNQPDRARPGYARRVTRSPSPMNEAPRDPARETTSRSRESTYDSIPRVREPTRDSPVREPVQRSREAREPVREDYFRDARDPRLSAHRTASARYPDRPQAAPARTTSYVYTPGGVEPLPTRPPLSRENSPRDTGLYYGEIPTTRSSHQRSATEDASKFARPMRPENIKFQSGYGYSPRPSTDRPQVSRNNSGGVYHQQQQPVRA
ncbi:hypothetical protein CKM354_000311800 [Cercospora kikuchii]|uniref:J domain-containing protein n=1 Tax=Cercospora kikuchii TaxID=84275 RepID=A0A9P3CBJ7_9PEZI|nr:uncharacterized protein CKM354_000311800 [Cercospora kikuchii]GIZ39746.1 hypothetical protein CKM354_000311800 [Cercospora kikuchii]